MMSRLPVHCRIGSLEGQLKQQQSKDRVHCRIGSLEEDLPQ